MATSSPDINSKTIFRILLHVCYVVGHFMVNVPALMSVMAFMSSLGLGMLSAVFFGLESALYLTVGLVLVSASTLGIGVFSACVLGLVTLALHQRLRAMPSYYEKQPVKFAGIVASLIALLFYPTMLDITMLNLTEMESFIGRIVYGVVVCILTMIAILSEIDWYVKNFTPVKNS